MMKRKRYFSVILLLALVCLFNAPSMVGAQPLTHTVVKGDTLWDICEKYYGDPNLWPQLWEMNPFITNPHLLEAGDVITLLDMETVRLWKETGRWPSKSGTQPGRPGQPGKTTEYSRFSEEGKKMPIPGLTPMGTGIDVSDLTNINALGYLSPSKEKPWGRIFSSHRDKVMSSKGDLVFVVFDKGKDVKPGDEFAISRWSGSLANPVRIGSAGYALSIRGRLVVEEPVDEEFKETSESEFYGSQNVYKARILESYVDIYVDDLLLPYEPVSPCVKPLPIDREVLGNIVAVQHDMQIVGQYSVVYIDQGFNEGIRRGDLFKVIEPRPSPGRNVDLPDRVLGAIMVLDSRPETASALVLSSKHEFPNGAYIKGLYYVETPTFLSLLPSCSVE
jgi:hypothetical protein